MNLYTASAYIRHLFNSRSTAGHGVHSPYMFDFITKVMRGRCEQRVMAEVESLRKEMLADRRTVTVTDLGAGSSKFRGAERRISDIAAAAAMPKKEIGLLAKIARGAEVGAREMHRRVRSYDQNDRDGDHGDPGDEKSGRNMEPGVLSKNPEAACQDQGCHSGEHEGGSTDQRAWNEKAGGSSSEPGTPDYQHGDQDAEHAGSKTTLSPLTGKAHREQGTAVVAKQDNTRYGDQSTGQVTPGLEQLPGGSGYRREAGNREGGSSAEGTEYGSQSLTGAGASTEQDPGHRREAENREGGSSAEDTEYRSPSLTGAGASTEQDPGHRREAENREGGSSAEDTEYRSPSLTGAGASTEQSAGHRTHNTGIILELGTSLGISTLALALAAPDKRVVTVEGCPVMAEIASANLIRHGAQNAEVINMEFSQALEKLRAEGTTVSMALIDGNHTGDALKKYVNGIMMMGEEMIIVADDIHMNSDMFTAWHSLATRETAPAALETFRLGMLFRMRSLTPGYYRIRY
ncbi:MAG: class I SAM-dependent methyltransferase [Bacteroidales bacterium]|jgi:precorrin-6B methylase 2|nr:class I SAM-dependent methyltransferase [Bacteroidales bacterium]